MMPTEEEVLDRKRRSLKRWAVVLGVLVILIFIGLGGMILDRLLKGAPGGGLEINVSKLEKKLAWLGSEVRDVNETISKQLGLSSTDGVLVNSVAGGSPADTAGIQRGDVILALDSTAIKDSFHIQEEILRYEPGDTVKILVDTADSGKRIVYVKLAANPSKDTPSKGTDIKKVADTTSEAAAAPRLSTPWGIAVSPLTQDLREQFNIPSSERGVPIVAVVKNSPADAQGLEVGDVIESVNKTPTPNLQTFYRALEESEGALMDVYSPDEGKRFFVTLPDEGDSPPQVVLVSFNGDSAKKDRIAIASDSGDLDGAVFYRFGSSPYFIVYDAGRNEMAAIRNPYAAQVRGMGIVVAQMLIPQDIDAVIVGGIGPQAFDAFHLAKVKVYGGVTGTVRNAIAGYQLGRLRELKEANLGGYGYSAGAAVPTGSSPWTEDSEEEEQEGYQGQPQTIPPKGKPGSEATLVAGSEARANRPAVCVCPKCGAEVTHPSSVSCSEMVCPICGSRLMTASPGSESSGGEGAPKELPATEIPTRVRPITLTGGTPVSSAPGAVPPANLGAQRTASNLWAISSKPDNIPPMVGQQTGGAPADAATTSKVSTCFCPLCGTTVTHPVGVPCAALQCPTCGGRMVSGTGSLTGGSPMAAAGGTRTGGKPEGAPPVQQVYYLVPISSKPGNVPLLGKAQQTAAVPVAGGATQGGPNTGGPTAGGPATSGQPGGGGQAGAGSPQSGRSTVCICPLCKTTVTHPIGVPCAALTCPVCKSRLVNAQPGGTSGIGAASAGGSPTAVAGGMQTGGKPEGVPPVQQTYYLVPISGRPENLPLAGGTQQVAYVLVAGGPSQGGPNTGGPAAGGPAIDGPSMGGGQAGTGAAQTGRSAECVCPMCKTTVTHPIGVPCGSLTCPVCGSRLVNAQPGGASGGAAAMAGGSPMAATGGMQTAGPTQVAQSKVIQVSTVSKRVVVPSTGRSLNSDIAPLLDKAPYFMMFGLGRYEVVRNPYYRDSGARGAEVAQFIVGEGGAVVICNNVSMTALKGLKDLRVKVYTGFTGTVKQALDIYADGRLKDSGTMTGIVLDDATEGEHGGGGGPPSSKDRKKDKGDSQVY
jgi:predicted Fe-Mo cluster-binding NifX family protein